MSYYTDEMDEDIMESWLTETHINPLLYKIACIVMPFALVLCILGMIFLMSICD